MRVERKKKERDKERKQKERRNNERKERKNIGVRRKVILRKQGRKRKSKMKELRGR